MNPTPYQLQSHASYLLQWEKAMRCGLMGGRPFSESTIMVYTLYVKWFLSHHGCVSISNLKLALLDIPPEQFAKRFKLYQALNSLAKYLIDESQLSPEYLKQVKVLKPRRHLPPKRITVSHQGIQELLTHCKKPTDRVLVLLLSLTGLRVTEAASLRLEDIDLKQGILIVRLAKWGKTRRIGIPQKLIAAVEEFLNHRPTTLDHDYLFSKINGMPIDRFGIRTRLEKLGNKAGIEVTPHALRRAFVTINANKERPLPMLQIACGHSSITTTRTYCLTSEDETIEAMKGWD